MTRRQLFEQPPFIPILDHLEALSGRSIGLTGHRGVLGGILHRRLESARLPVTVYQGDVRDPQAVQSWIAEARPDLVFHLAAVVPLARVAADPLSAYTVNAVGAFNVAAALVRHVPSAWFFLASSSHVYAPQPLAHGHPIVETTPTFPATVYGITKLAAEQLVTPLLELYGVPWCVGRIFSYSHTTQRPPFLVPSILQQLRSDTGDIALDLSSPRTTRDFLDADTVVDALLALAVLGHCGVVNIGSGRGTSIEELAHHLSRLHHTQVRIRDRHDATPDYLVADVAALQAALIALT